MWKLQSERDGVKECFTAPKPTAVGAEEGHELPVPTLRFRGWDTWVIFCRQQEVGSLELELPLLRHARQWIYQFHQNAGSPRSSLLIMMMMMIMVKIIIIKVELSELVESGLDPTVQGKVCLVWNWCYIKFEHWTYLLPYKNSMVIYTVKLD